LKERKNKTGAERQAAYAASGRAIACVIRDPEAINALAALEATHGGVTAAITAVLRRVKLNDERYNKNRRSKSSQPASKT
jgi:hypothetical protein